MKSLITQNTNMAYPNMMNYQMNYQIPRPIDPSNQIQYAFQQAQNQRVLYPYMINANITQPQIQNINNVNAGTQINTTLTNNQNNNSIPVPDNSSTKVDYNNTQITSSSFKILTKYKDIYVPSIYLIDYNDTSKSPFNLLSSQNQTQTYNQLTGQIMNNQSNNIFNKYFNYGYNLEQWKAYVNDIKNKFDELNELVKNGNIRLPEPDNELEYLMAFPSDYGGLGNVQNDQNYENVKFYDPKDTTKNQGNKNFMSLIKFERDQIWFSLEPNPSSLNKKFNDYNKIINSSVNPNLKYYLQPNFFIRNLNNISSTIIPNPEQKANNGSNSNNKNESGENKKER